jgi:hypothetical protein
MDIVKTLLAEHSRSQSEKIAGYIGKDPERFDVLMLAFFKGEYRLAQRAAWPMSICAENHPELIRPYLKKLVSKLSEPGIHDALVRNTLRLLQFIEIPPALQGKLMDTCFQFIQSPQAPGAIKAFSISILARLGEQYPDIIPELKLILQAQWPHEGPAFRSRARKILSSQ